MAQWIARKTSNLKVVGSNPTMDFFLKKKIKKTKNLPP
jgi:hypothetical protein